MSSTYLFVCISTAWKLYKYGVFSGPYFTVFWLNTEIYRLNLRIQSKYGKIQTRKNSVFGHFSPSEFLIAILRRSYWLVINILLTVILWSSCPLSIKENFQKTDIWCRKSTSFPCIIWMLLLYLQKLGIFAIRFLWWGWRYLIVKRRWKPTFSNLSQVNWVSFLFSFTMYHVYRFKGLLLTCLPFSLVRATRSKMFLLNGKSSSKI